MKKTKVLILLSVIAINAHTQDIDTKNVPAVLLNAFQLKFVHAEDVEWELEKGLYHVEFEINDKDYEAWLDNKGNIVKHEQELWESEIPATVISTIRGKCAFFDLDDAEREEENGQVLYKINFEIDDMDHDFRIDENGKLLSYRKELKKNEIPETILTAIRSKYRSLDIDEAVQTEESGTVRISVEGEVNDRDHFFLFSAEGKMLKHRQDLRKSEIPVAVMKAISSLYAGYEIRDADLIEEGVKSTYEIKLRRSKERIRVFFHPGGEVLEVLKD